MPRKFTRNFGILLGIAFFFKAITVDADTIYVPADYPNIQEGIDAANDGDIVLVASGTYSGDGNKNLDFKGEAITVQSEKGAEFTIIDCEGDGRGFYFHSGEDSSSQVSGFTIKNGWADYGGGIYCENSASPTIVDNTITENFAYGGGGGIYCQDSSPTIARNILTENSTPASGGGIYCYKNSSPTIVNNVIAGNSATGSEGGGGIFCRWQSSPTIKNNTLVGNSARYRGGGISCGGIRATSPVVFNTIIWMNTADLEGHEIYVGDPTTITISYSDIRDGAAGIGGSGVVNMGEGNIATDPLFVDIVNGDYHLTDYSPCIGAGRSNGAPPKDIEGNPRGTPPDMGAYENSRDTPLFVLLSKFTAEETSDGIILKWRTESEVNNLGFNIYRSMDVDVNYVKITPSLIRGHGTDATPRDYFFTDEGVEEGFTYYYYIEDVDFSGKRGRSHPIQITVGQNTKSKSVVVEKFALLQNYPNPFNSGCWLPYQLAQDVDVTIRIYNIKGQLVFTLSLGYKKAGFYIAKEDAAYWDGKDFLGEQVPSGVYFYTLHLSVPILGTSADKFRAKKLVIVPILK